MQPFLLTIDGKYLLSLALTAGEGLLVKLIPVVEVPDSVDDETEGGVALDASAYMRVVLNKFELGNHLYGLVAVHDAVVHFESLCEILRDVGVVPLAHANLRVTRGIEARLDHRQLDGSRHVCVKLVEGLLDEGCPERTHRSDEHFDKFVIFNLVALAYIESLEPVSDIDLWQVNVEVLNCLQEFFVAKRSRLVVVHYTELSPQADEALRASLEQLGAEALHEDRLVTSEVDLLRMVD